MRSDLNLIYHLHSIIHAKTLAIDCKKQSCVSSADNKKRTAILLQHLRSGRQEPRYETKISPRQFLSDDRALKKSWPMITLLTTSASTKHYSAHGIRNGAGMATVLSR